MSEKKISISKNERNKISKNNQASKIYYNQIIKNIDLNNNISNSSISLNDSLINNKENNNLQSNTSFSYQLHELQRIEKSHPNYLIISLYNELLSILKNFNNNYNDNNIYKEFNINLNLMNNTNCSKETILNIFKKTFLQIINIKTKELKESIEQYRSYILLLEQKNRYFIQQYFLKKTKVDILENEIDSYMEIEEEFYQMKEKLKYENGKFLHNEKKENEILILRAENSNLKKIIDQNEKLIEEKDIIIESIKKKSSSMINTNRHTFKNSFDLKENVNNQNSSSSLIIIKHNKIKSKEKLSHNNSIYAYSTKIYSPINNNRDNDKENNHLISNNYNNNNSFHIKKISYVENLSTKISEKALINRKLKNKVLNMKKLRRINDNPLEKYNKSSAHISNSIMSNNSNSSNLKTIRKNINSFNKNIQNNPSSVNNRIHKKLSSDLTNYNFKKDTRFIKKSIKNNDNKKSAKNVFDNNNDRNKITHINNNRSYMLKTSDKKCFVSKKIKNKTKTSLKVQKDISINDRNSYLLLKSPTTNNNIEKNIGIKDNIKINSFIQNSSEVPISVPQEKNNISYFEQNQFLSNKVINNKYSLLPDKIKNNKIKSNI